jgi:hypothetical protein
MIDNIRSKLDLNFKYMNQVNQQPHPQDNEINSPKISAKREDSATILHVEKKRHHHQKSNNIHTQPNDL